VTPSHLCLENELEVIGADGSANIALAPTTPHTPGQDPVTHISDNESSGGFMETVDDTSNETCNVKQWMLFSEATRELEAKSVNVAQPKTQDDEAEEEAKEEEQVNHFWILTLYRWWASGGSFCRDSGGGRRG